MLTFAQLQSEVGEWSRRNFPNNTPRDPYEGVIEELGELAHARLKGRQGIRGDSAKHEAGEKDALADMIIFACNYADRSETSLAAEVDSALGMWNLSHPDDDSISTLQEHIRHGDLFNTVEDAFDEIVVQLGSLAQMGGRMGEVIIPIVGYSSLRGFDLESIVAETWEQVRQRDWRKDPVGGGMAAPAPQVKVMDFARGEIVTLPTVPNGVVR